MKLGPDAYDVGLQAFARESGAPADGRATRTRVLAAVGARLQRRSTGRRFAAGGLVALVAALSGSAAWTAVGRWRAAAPRSLTLSTPRAASPPRAPVREPLAPAAETAIPPAPPSSGAVSASDLDAESRLYESAHEAHFGADAPRRALVAWNRYLATYPRGTFAPEARYNRALCLLRLGRRELGLAALRPFARGAYGAYRRQEAATLIERLGTEDP